MTIRVGVVGGSGYIGGELLRLLLGHPHVEVAAATSNRYQRKRVDGLHPNLRGRTDLRFVTPEQLGEYDVLMLATPHRQTMVGMRGFMRHAGVIVDLSGDFRLADPQTYERHYGLAHTEPDLLESFTPGIPELHRKRLGEADLISVPGCMANAGILALYPAARTGLLGPDVTIDARTGSSGSGSDAGPANVHAERSGAMRVFAPTSHRHSAEVEQVTGLRVKMTATGVEAVRGVQVLARGELADGADEAALRTAYRECYADEPFVRVVAHRSGTYRLPEPKILNGSNYCDVGFAVEDRDVLLIGALDNLVKGGAGNAVQCLNIRFGWPEQLGLEFTGLHPA